MKKVLIIQNESEFKFIEKNILKYKSFYKIIWFPITFSEFKNKNYKIAANFLKKKYKINCDTNFDFNLNNYYKIVDQILSKKINKIPKHIGIFQNARHEFKNMFDFYYNEIAKLDYLISLYKISEIHVFNNNKKKFTQNVGFVLNYIKNHNIKIITLEPINNSNSFEIIGYNDLFPNFYKLKSNLKDKIKSIIKNFYLNSISLKQKNILIIDGNKLFLKNLKKIKEKKNKIY